MSQDDSRALAVVDSRQLLPDRQSASAQLQAVRQFQATVRELFVKDLDYGVIPNTGNKPTLLKPGAEKLAKMLQLADYYDIVNEVEDWDRPLFRYLIRCRLQLIGTDTVISTGLGECNSMESKYRYRWAWPSELSQEERHLIAAQRGATREVQTKNGKTTKYRVDNDDVYSQVNTILKMAKKRALVDAALSAGRLSDLFTQDLDEFVIEGEFEPVAESRAEPPPRAQQQAASRAPTQPPKNQPATPRVQSTAADGGQPPQAKPIPPMPASWQCSAPACPEELQPANEIVFKGSRWTGGQLWTLSHEHADGPLCASHWLGVAELRRLNPQTGEPVDIDSDQDRLWQAWLLIKQEAEAAGITQIPQLALPVPRAALISAGQALRTRLGSPSREGGPVSSPEAPPDEILEHEVSHESEVPA